MAIRWLLVVVSLVALQWIIIVPDARQNHFCGNYDPASYYSTAVNFAQGRGLVDSCLWHCLGPSPTVVRAAGDYWLPGWPFVLGSAMRVCGTSFESAAFIMAGLSLLLPLGIAVLVWRWGQPWYAAWLAGILVCLHDELHSWVSTDVILSYELVCVAGLISIPTSAAPAAVSLAGAICMLGTWFRGEGFIMWLAGAAVLAARRRPKILAWWSVGGLAVVVTQIAYNLWAFGHVLPPPRSAIPWLVCYGDLYAFQPLPDFHRWLAQGLRLITWNVAHCAWVYVRYVKDQVPWPLLVTAVVGACRLWRAVPGARAAVWFLVLSTVLPPLVYPVVANGYRLAVQMPPILCALAAAALVDLPRRLSWGGLAIFSTAIFCYYFWFYPLPFWLLSYHPAQFSRPDYLSDDLRQQLRLKQDDVVMCSDPWEVSACLGVNTVICPMNGAGPVYQSIARYHPRFLLAHANDTTTAFIQQTHLDYLKARVRLQSHLSMWIELTY